MYPLVEGVLTSTDCEYVRLYVARVKFACNVLHPVRFVVRFLVFAVGHALVVSGFNLQAPLIPTLYSLFIHESSA